MPAFGPRGGVLAHGDLDASIGFWRDRLRAKPAQLRANLWLARLLREGSRDAEAVPHWTAVLNADPSHFEAAYQLALAAPAGGESLDGSPHAAAIAALLRNPPAPVSHRRHVAIAGVSYSGSTLLDRILGSLPGCGSVGESHWLVDRRLPGRRATIDPSDPKALGLVPCATCGPNCETLTFDFRVGLLGDRRQWYDRIAERLGTETLISSDKTLPKLLENDPLLRFDAIVLFKSPAQAWKSQSARSEFFNRYRSTGLRRYLEAWRDRYSSFLNDFRPSGKVVFLSFDAFSSEPRTFLTALCELLGLAYDPRVITSSVPRHSLGGNKRVREELQGTNTTEIRPLPALGLSAEEQEAIDTDAATLEVFEALMRRHHEAFGQ